ncbi:type II toxin-antitoxin system PemK/MazF family toxin [bacterium]|nr:type II toxin-antitoxin system PemK/MazF family toxin [bacterium]MBU1427958.1 type II toxin-antitoxin system PemK/MazF family toxin [bacterium]MBU2440293.1 type II toxin-antitoxin system PemK/MazF family toxin [bacterium]
MKYKQGDVVLVKVIFSEGSGVKKRPSLIITNDKYYHNHREYYFLRFSEVQKELSGIKVELPIGLFYLFFR